MTQTFDFIKIRRLPMSPLLVPLPPVPTTFDGLPENLAWMHRRGWGDGKNYICTVADRHGNPPQKYDIDIYNIYWRYILYIYVHTCTTHPLTHTHTLNQHHFQVWEVGNNFCDNSLLQVLTGGLRTFKCCHYNFFSPPNSESKMLP